MIFGMTYDQLALLLVLFIVGLTGLTVSLVIFYTFIVSPLVSLITQLKQKFSSKKKSKEEDNDSSYPVTSFNEEDLKPGQNPF